MEQFELVDINGNKTGAIININDYRGAESIPEGKYMLIVKVAIINEDKKILLQKRSMNKLANPGQWGLTGGKVNAGEDTLTTAIRETYEEIGINLNKKELKFLCKYNTRKAVFIIYYIKKDINIEDCKMQTEEVDELRYFSINELEELEKVEGKQWLAELKAIL